MSDTERYLIIGLLILLGVSVLYVTVKLVKGDYDE